MSDSVSYTDYGKSMFDSFRNSVVIEVYVSGYVRHVGPGYDITLLSGHVDSYDGDAFTIAVPGDASGFDRCPVSVTGSLVYDHLLGGLCVRVYDIDDVHVLEEYATADIPV